MRPRTILAILVLAMPFVALPASADCQVVSPAGYPDINYTTVCAGENFVYGDGTQEFDNDYVAHMSHAAEADPYFEYADLRVDQGQWTYDDGETSHERTWTHIGSNSFDGVRGVAGTGYHANLNQRDQTAGEDAGDACSSFIGRSTCVGAGSWFTLQGYASVGIGIYYQQTGSGEDCQERAEVDVDAVVVFVPVVREPAPCTMEAPFLYEELPFRELPIMP